MPLHYINGKFTRGGATENIDVYDPATEEILDTVPRGTAGVPQVPGQEAGG